MSVHLHGFDGCPWLRCRQSLEKHRRDCVNATDYFEAAVAEARIHELQQMERKWQREVLVRQFLSERRKLGEEFRAEFQELLLRLDRSFKSFKAQKQRRLAQVGKAEGSTAEQSEAAEEAEEEEREEDEIVEVQRRSEILQESFIQLSSHPTLSASMSTFPLITQPPDEKPPTPKSETVETPCRAPCRVHSVKAIELKSQARKLALVQRYAAAAKLQAKAEKIEEEWRQSHRVKQKEARRNHEEEALERERLRLERRLQEEQRALGERALREQQQLMHQHERRKERLVLRQQKVWKCVGSGSLEEALKQAAGRRSDARKAKRPASAPDRGRPRGGR
ncbi:unnamed protein product [Durusdinium trenchii]|uniref:Uncharacterized protein n=1 Tax=Durusdinium trenchii TaxID=1381693 RepID=A0ABP0MP39_9DINO